MKQECRSGVVQVLKRWLVRRSVRPWIDALTSNRVPVEGLVAQWKPEPSIVKLQFLELKIPPFGTIG